MYPATGKLGCEHIVCLADHGSTRTSVSKKFLFQVNWGHYCVLKDIVGMCLLLKKIYSGRIEAKQFLSFHRVQRIESHSLCPANPNPVGFQVLNLFKW